MRRTVTGYETIITNPELFEVKPQRLDVYIVNLGEQKGHIQGGVRPCVVLSNNRNNMFSPVVMVAAITSQNKKNLPTHVDIKAGNAGLEKDSTILLEQSTLINKSQILRKIGSIRNNDTIKKINSGINLQFGLVM